MSVIAGGLRNEPVDASEVAELLAPLLAIVGDGINPRDVVSIAITRRAIRAKVAVRNTNRRRIARAWAHLEVTIVDDEEA